MARQIVETITSDLSGDADAQEYTWALGSQQYTADLTAEEITRLEKALADFVAVARKSSAGRSGGSRRSRGSSSRSGSGSNATEVRNWLREAGYEVSDRGRISADLQAAYESKTPAAKK